MKTASGKNGNLPILLCASIAAVLSVLLVALFLFSFVRTGGYSHDLSRLYTVAGRLPITVTVFGRGADTLSARIAFYTPEGDLTGTVERSWSGWELKLDCVVIGGSSGWLVFPFLAYTEETTRGRGVALIPKYVRGSFPSLYESPALSPRERAGLRRIFGIVRTESWMPAFLGSLHHEILTVRVYEPGTEYSVFVTRDGSLRLGR
jgi:hypothetical protein